MSIYSAVHLNLRYTDPNGHSKLVLSDIDIDIRAGECIGILGQSGGGKTQLVLALARLNEYRGGLISCSSNLYYTPGNEIWDLMNPLYMAAFRKSEIGYIFQEPTAYFNPTIKIGKQIITEKRQVTNPAVLKGWFLKVGLEDYDRIRSSYPHQLSGGQLQRLAILACLIRKPRIVIADEITASLDPDTSRLILKLLLELKKELGYSLLWVTHDESEAIHYCDRIWVIEQGKLKIYESTNSFPLNEFHLDYKRKRLEQQGEIFRMSNIYKSYHPENTFFRPTKPSHLVLKDISMILIKGESLGIVGPSGGGKSTLAKIIAGIETWDRGEQYFKSHKVFPGGGMKREIIYLFQDAFSSLNPQLTCRYLLGEAIKAGRNKFSVNVILQLAQLDSTVLTKKAISLSGGLRQRFALARALAANPEILIMDESVNALDIGLQKQILEMLIRQQKATQMTILFISHQVEVVKQFTDRQLLMDNGVLAAIRL